MTLARIEQQIYRFLNHEQVKDHSENTEADQSQLVVDLDGKIYTLSQIEPCQYTEAYDTEE